MSKQNFIGLEFGCGETPAKPEYLGVDIRDFPNVKYICNAWEIAEHVGAESINDIYSKHFLEHLTFYDVDRTLKSWHSILKPGASLHIIVPDIMYHINQFLDPKRTRRMRIKKGKWTVEDMATFGFWGFQRQTELGETWDIHKSGYDFPLLERKLIEHGFARIERLATTPPHLSVVAFKE